MARALYTLLLHLSLPMVLVRLWWRGRKEPGYRLDWPQRFGRFGRKPVQPVIWLHAVSLGETHAARPLVEALRDKYPQHQLLITHMTATGRAAATELFGSYAQLAWLPYDFPWAMEAFFRHFKPEVGVLMETEVWPNLTQAARDANVPMVLANARLSARSLRGYLRVRQFVRGAFAGLTVGAQTEADAGRLKQLGVSRIEVTGNLKFDLTVPDDALPRARALRQLLGARRVLLAASTREGEEVLLLDALNQIPADVVLMIVPRHPQRFDAVATLLAQRQIGFMRRSAGKAMPAEAQVFLGDSMGEMPVYYAACDCAYVGGSLLPFGGQNLIEACAAGVPVLVGPYTYNFAQAAEQAVAAGAAVRVADVPQLTAAAMAIFSDSARSARMGQAGQAFCEQHRGATGRTMALIGHVLSNSR